MATRRARDIARTSRAMQKILNQADDRARQIAELILDEIKERAPYDDRHSTDTTGVHLRDSYRLERGVDGDWLITTDRRYWRFVEFGTKEHGDAQPHIRPAIEYARGVFS
jgi:HK97 gp10 family phage protein